MFDRAAAVSASPVGRARTTFSVIVTFDGADDPQVIADGVGTAATVCDAARAWAMAESFDEAIRVFGVREVREDGRDLPTAQERMLRRMLNGGGFSVKVANAHIVGTFEGYVPAR